MSPAEPETVSLADGADGTAATDPEGTLRLLGLLTLPCPERPDDVLMGYGRLLIL